MLGYRLWSQDVTEAFLQSTGKLMPEIYIKHTKEFKLDRGRFFRLLKPLYGLTDPGDYWDATIIRNMQDDLHLSQIAHHICLFFKRLHGELQGLSGVYFHHKIQAGTPAFLYYTAFTKQRFKSKPHGFDTFKLSRVKIETI